MPNKLVQRSDKIAYYGVPSTTAEGGTVYHRMTGFTSLSSSKNAKEYSRQYVDQAFEQTDVTGYSPSISYAFDQYTEDPVHTDIVSITDNEKVGTDAVREIILVDKTTKAASGFHARKRSFAVIPDSDGDSVEAYTYSGTFKAKGEGVVGTAIMGEDDQTITFSAGVSE